MVPRPRSRPTPESAATRRRARGHRRLGAAMLVLVATFAAIAGVGAAGATEFAVAAPVGAPASGQALDPPKRCVGAAARAPGRRCSTTSRAVRPTPDDALITPNVGCIPPKGASGDQFQQCSYGVPAAGAISTAALIGDSHAAHWRGAVASVAEARRWHVLEFARPHCPFTLAKPDQAYSDFCVSYNREMLGYLAAHPEIETVFVSVNHFVNVVVGPGQTKASAKLAGHLAAFEALPASVKHVVVIRDSPQDRVDTADCVRDAIERRKAAAKVCGVPRRRALRDDLEAAAARQLGAPRFNVVDFTPFFCSERLCYPVVGGVLVHKDQDHLGQRFVKTLAPFLLEQVDAFVPREGAPAPGMAAPSPTASITATATAPTTPTAGG